MSITNCFYSVCLLRKIFAAVLEKEKQGLRALISKIKLMPHLTWIKYPMNILTESQNSWVWTASLELMLCNHPAQARLPNSKSQSCPDAFWYLKIFGYLQLSHSFCAICAMAWSLSQSKIVFWCSGDILLCFSLFQFIYFTYILFIYFNFSLFPLILSLNNTEPRSILLKIVVDSVTRSQ